MNRDGAPLEFDVLVQRRKSATQGGPPGKEHLDWVANSATLIYGARDAVLVDTFLSDEQTGILADWIERHGRTLRTIYITHGHPDHFFGLHLLRLRFPEARAVAAAGAVAAMRRSITPEMITDVWEKRFPGQVPANLELAEPLSEPTLELEGHELRVIDLGRTDTSATTALHVPAIDLVVSGDGIYADTHLYLAEADVAGRTEWIKATDTIAALDPKAVVVGHGPLAPDHSPRHIAATRRYIEDFNELDAATSDPLDFYERMISAYPDRINPGSLWGAVHAAKAR